MIRPPPGSPLFPYTPLFRSWHAGGSSRARRGGGPESRFPLAPPRLVAPRRMGRRVGHGGADRRRRPPVRPAARPRPGVGGVRGFGRPDGGPRRGAPLGALRPPARPGGPRRERRSGTGGAAGGTGG